MGLLKIPDHSQDGEHTDLHTHVLLAEQRRINLEERLNHIMAKIDNYEKQRDVYKRMMIGSVLSVIVGMVNATVSIILTYNILR
jgi:hypothetical protein